MQLIENLNEKDMELKLLLNDLRVGCVSNDGSIILRTLYSIKVLTPQIERLINRMLNINNNIEHKKLEMLEKKLVSTIKLFEKTICKTNFCKTIKIKDNCENITNKFVRLVDEIRLLKELSVMQTGRERNSMKRGKTRRTSVHVNKYNPDYSKSNSNRSMNSSRTLKSKPSTRFSVVATPVNNSVFVGSKGKPKPKKKKSKKGSKKNRKSRK